MYISFFRLRLSHIFERCLNVQMLLERKSKCRNHTSIRPRSTRFQSIYYFANFYGPLLLLNGFQQKRINPNP